MRINVSASLQCVAVAILMACVGIVPSLYAVEGEIPIEGETQFSCEGYCGGRNPDGDCFCEAGCIEFGDCCYDAAEVCPDEFPPEGEPPAEGEDTGFACPENAVISQPGTEPGTVGYTPDYTLLEFDLLESGQVSLILDNFTLVEETTLCSMTWWGVEVDAGGIDCVTTEKTFAVAIVNLEDNFDDPEYVQNITMTNTDVGSATMKGQEVTIYRYHADLLTNCAILAAGEHYISIVGLESGTPGCSFGWMNTVNGDDTYFGVGETGPFPITGNLAFCLGLGSTPVEGEPVEGEPIEGEPVEGETPEGEIPECTAPAPYGPEDPCYVEVILADSYCCTGEWDSACQVLYNDCAKIPHPADLDVDWTIKLPEAIAYLSGWQQGSNPIGIAIRAAFIWQNGEAYAYDALVDPPNCWILAE